MNSRGVSDGPQAKKRGLPWWGWVLIVLGVSVPACGVLSALAIYGVSKYVKDAKSAEARHILPLIASSIVRCAASPGADGAPHGLPPSSASVPSLPPPGKKYMSATSDWTSQEAFRCAGFSLSDPQYFSYQWQAQSATAGVIVALADLNGDGSVDFHFEQSVECTSPSSCTPGPLIQR